MKRINFFNIVHHYKPYNYFEITGNNEKSKKKFAQEVLRFCKHFLLCFINLKGFFTFSKLKGKTLFYVGTINQYNSIKKIQSRIPNSEIISIRFQEKQLKKFNDIIYVNPFLAYIISILMFPYFLYLFIMASNRERIRYRFFFYEHFLSLGLDSYWNIFYFFYKPKKVIIVNELKSEYRTFVLNAKKHNIPSYYIAHGVTFDFKNDLDPICDNYLLSGKYEFDHYTRNNQNKLFYFVGRPLYDGLKIKTPVKKVKKVGICSNSLSNIDKVVALINKLKNNFSVDIYYRPHPGHNENTEKEFCKKLNLKYSNSNLIKSNTFLSEIDLIISGESSIIIEAVYSGVFSVIYPFDNKFSDLQKFVENKVTKYCKDFTEFKSFFENLNFDFDHINKYVYNEYYPLTSTVAIVKIIEKE